MSPASRWHVRPVIPLSLVLVALALVLGQAASAGTAHAKGSKRHYPTFSNEEIVRTAQNYPHGSWGGQCREFVGDVLTDILAERYGFLKWMYGYGAPGGAYYGAYEKAGGKRVDLKEATRGDILQVIMPEHRHSDRPPQRSSRNRSVLHTAIITERLGRGRFRVLDSNWVRHETIGTHSWRPATVRKDGAEVYAWRFGEIPRAWLPDRDDDGTPDAEDLCPREPGPADNNGCRRVIPEQVGYTRAADMASRHGAPRIHEPEPDPTFLGRLRAFGLPA